VPADDGYFVGIGISGGGSRSANFAAACMFHLQRLGLLQRADYISAVSGGTLAAAYYCVSTDEEWNPGNVQEKLTHSFATDSLIGTFLPWNMIWMLVTDWDRSDLLAGSFKNVLFTRDRRELTFGDLRGDRPRLLINATDLQSGKGFVFCDETFDRLNSDLSRYPLAHAVTASSAVPVLLHQVTLRDFSTTFKQYRHLVDGGVVDNLGVKTLVEMYRAQVRENPSLYRRGAVFIVLDARTQHDARIASRGDTSLLESLQFGTGLTSTVLLNRASSATLAEIILDSSPDSLPAAELRRNRDALINGGYVELSDIDGRPVYVLHLAMSRVDDVSDLPFHSFKQSLNNIATYFNISDGEAAQLYQAANLLVEHRFRGELATIADELNGRRRAPEAPTGPATRP
jgi:predicted acylesterase/phospholipase RssA